MSYVNSMSCVNDISYVSYVSYVNYDYKFDNILLTFLYIEKKLLKKYFTSFLYALKINLTV